SVHSVASLAFHPDKIVDALDHAAHRRRVDELHLLVDPLEAQAQHRRAVPALAAVRALHQDDLDLLGAHDRISSIFLPRLAAISEGVFIACSPFRVARTTLYGLVEPKHLASTLVTPMTSNTARIGPPAMMPVPSEAGC